MDTYGDENRMTQRERENGKTDRQKIERKRDRNKNKDINKNGVERKIELSTGVAIVVAKKSETQKCSFEKEKERKEKVKREQGSLEKVRKVEVSSRL